MDNFSESDLELVNEMWNEVKLITLSDLALIVVAAVIVVIVAAVIIYKYQGRIFKFSLRSERRKGQKKGWKVVKIEDAEN